MKFTADLHLHSHYSRATSKDLDFEHLARWAQLKGVHVVGTGDIAHPGWLAEMKANLEPAEAGLFRLNADLARAVQATVPPACRGPVRFMLAGEISSIYKKHDRVRKVHNVIFAPSLEAVEKIQAALEKIGNIRSDGRPILGLDSRDLLEIILHIDPQNYLIPAHIWTPWFSMLGSKSGFDAVEECFDDLTPHIFALETGLSSDPPMNWRVSNLDRYTLVSNSDAHSPQKLAREANLFHTELSYPAIFAALKSGHPDTFLGTLEFFPEEGKYHLDGHRKCNLRWEPPATMAHGGLCAVCGKPVTVGVMHRVEILANRPPGGQPARTHPYRSLIPLPEILAQVHGVGPTAKRVQQDYEALLAKLGPELTILLDTPLADLELAGGSLLAEGIRRMRAGEVSLAGGYDGEYGVVKLFTAQERSSLLGQLRLFAPPARPAPAAARVDAPPQGRQPALFPAPPAPESLPQSAPAPVSNSDAPPLLAGLNPEQQAAALCTDAPLLIVAGPGTGKTRTLTHRLAYLIHHRGALPETMLAITFTNKAAQEMAGRLADLLEPDAASRLIIKTFHAFGAMLLRAEAQAAGLSPQFALTAEADRPVLLKQACPNLAARELTPTLAHISQAKNNLLPLDAPALETDPAFAAAYRAYESTLARHGLLDFDDLLLRPVALFETALEVLARWQSRFRWLAIDEYQDINHAQYRLLRLLAGGGANLCAIGDPDQAIYGFRGASRAYFLRFQQDFPAAQTVSLHRNYRSTQLILDASGQVIRGNPDGGRLALWGAAAHAAKLTVLPTPTDKAEAETVVHQIEQMVGGTSYFSLDSGRVDDDSRPARSFADFAVLYRLGAQSRLLAEAFDRSGIPYQTVGETPLAEHKAVKPLLAWLWAAHNPESAWYLAQALNLPEPVWDKLAAAAAARQEPVGEILQQYATLDFLRAGTRQQVAQAVPFLSRLQAAAGAQPVNRLVEQVFEFVTGQQRGQADEPVQRLIRRAALFDNRLGDFLESMALQKETDAYDPRADRVTLMTLHAAKGLEFPVVFMVGCEEEIIPYRREGERVDVAEERRLFYVGMTRAQQRLILTYAHSRMLFGRQRSQMPSRFVHDIETALKEFVNTASRPPQRDKPDAAQLTLF